MKPLGFLFAALLVIAGLVFCVAAAATGLWQRWILGGILLGSGFLLVFVLRMRVPDTKVTVHQKIDLSGEVQFEKLNCRSCGATLDPKSVTVKAGAIFVACPYCKSSYQAEEAPKW